MDLSRVPQKLKVVHIASGDRWAGAEVQLYTLLTQLSKDDDIEPSAILLNDGELAHRLRAQDIHVDVIDESKHSTLTIFRKLIKLLREHSPDIVHTHRQKENILGSLANFFSARAASVRTVHGAPEYGVQSIPQKAIDSLDRWTGNYLQQRIIAVSDDLALKLHQRFKPGHLVVIENGVDIDAVRSSVQPVDFRQNNPGTLHVGIVGRLDSVKRIDIFLEMSRDLLAKQPDHPWLFHVFGEGVLREKLEAQALALNISNKVIFHGHRFDIASCIAQLDALVICSDHEGLPMTALEAITLGTPLIAHSVGGLSVLLEDKVGGLLVQDHSFSGYADTVLAAINKHDVADKKRRDEKLITKYSSSINARRVLKLYDTVKKSNAGF